MQKDMRHVLCSSGIIICVFCEFVVLFHNFFFFLLNFMLFALYISWSFCCCWDLMFYCYWAIFILYCDILFPVNIFFFFHQWLNTTLLNKKSVCWWRWPGGLSFVFVVGLFFTQLLQCPWFYPWFSIDFGDLPLLLRCFIIKCFSYVDVIMVM